MNKIYKLWIALVTAGMLLIPALSYAQTSESAVTTTIGYFYSASGQMIDAEDNTGAMSSYLTRGERYNGTSETFAVSNIKDITADLDSNGNVLNKYTYTAYGTQTSYTSNTQINESSTPQLSLSVNPYTYSDYYTDSESGNYYLNARYYAPTLGLFLTSDSYNLSNRYMYVNGNPVMGVDPTGHWTFNLGLTHMTTDEAGGHFHWRCGNASNNTNLSEDITNVAKNKAWGFVNSNKNHLNEPTEYNNKKIVKNSQIQNLTKDKQFIKQLENQPDKLNKLDDERLYNNGYSFSSEEMSNRECDNKGGERNKLETFKDLNDGSIYLMTGFIIKGDPIKALDFDRRIHVTPFYNAAKNYAASRDVSPGVIYVWKLTKETLIKNKDAIVENGAYKTEPGQIVMNLTIDDLYGYIKLPKSN